MKKTKTKILLLIIVFVFIACGGNDNTSEKYYPTQNNPSNVQFRGSNENKYTNTGTTVNLYSPDGILQYANMEVFKDRQGNYYIEMSRNTFARVRPTNDFGFNYYIYSGTYYYFY